MNFTPNFAGIINALKYIIDNGVALGGGGGGGSGGGATATKQDEQISLLNLLVPDVEEIRGRLPQVNGKVSVENSLAPITEITGLSADTISANLLPPTDVSSYAYASLQVFGTFNAVYAFQGSNNGVNWENINIESKGGVDVGYFDFAPRIITFPINTKYIKIYLSSYTSGNVQGHLILYKNSPASNQFSGVVRTTGTSLVSTAKPNTVVTPVQNQVISSTPTIIYSNANRKGLTIYNPLSFDVFLDYTTVSSTSYATKINPDKYFELPYGFVGDIQIACASGNTGTIFIRELL
jgi:hypothetical protein